MGAKKLFSPFGILVLRWKLNRAKLVHEPRYRLVLASRAAPLGLLKLLLGARCDKVLGQFVAPWSMPSLRASLPHRASRGPLLN